MLTLSDIQNFSLIRVSAMHSDGRITDQVWDQYTHLWQTSSPRFALRACNCPTCKRTYPDTEYKTV